MRTRKTFLVLLIGVLGIATLSPKERKPFWEAPYQKWMGLEARELYNNSPWALRKIPASVLSGGGAQGEQNLSKGWTVRLISALPIREAYVRMFQINKQYDAMSESDRKKLDEQSAGFLQASVGDEIILGVEYATSDDDVRKSMNQLFSSGSVETLSSLAYLNSPRLGRLALAKYLPPDNQGFGARFVFPSTKNGQPALQEGDNELTFEFSPPKVSKLVVKFEPSKMVYKGKLEY